MKSFKVIFPYTILYCVLYNKTWSLIYEKRGNWLRDKIEYKKKTSGCKPPFGFKLTEEQLVVISLHL